MELLRTFFCYFVILLCPSHLELYVTKMGLFHAWFMFGYFFNLHLISRPLRGGVHLFYIVDIEAPAWWVHYIYVVVVVVLLMLIGDSPLNEYIMPKFLKIL